MSKWIKFDESSIHSQAENIRPYQKYIPGIWFNKKESLASALDSLHSLRSSWKYKNLEKRLILDNDKVLNKIWCNNQGIKWSIFFHQFQFITYFFIITLSRAHNAISLRMSAIFFQAHIADKTRQKKLSLKVKKNCAPLNTNLRLHKVSKQEI